MNKNNIYSILLGLSTLVVASPANAEDNPASNRDGRRGPPQVAIDACAELEQGSRCTFTGKGGKELSGTCFAPAERNMTCRPDGRQARRGGANRYPEQREVQQ